jgi:hypothetical protein
MSSESRSRLSDSKKQLWADSEFRIQSLILLKTSTSTPQSLVKRANSSKKLSERYTPEYKYWVAKKASCTRWGKSFNEPRPVMFKGDSING